MEPIADTPHAAPVADTSATSPTPDAAGSPSDRLARMTPAERSTWRQTGDVPGTTAQGDGDGGDDGGDVVEDHSVTPGDGRAAPPPAADASASEAGRTLAKRKQSAQDRINDLARKNYTLEGELKAVREQLSSRSAAAVDAPPAPAPSPARASSADPDEPQEDQFATYREYVVAAADYRIKVARDADRAERQQTERQQQQQTVATAYDARIRAFAADHPDFEDLVRNQTEVLPTPLLRDAVMHSELAPHIAYHLNTHLDEYRALVALPPGPMLKALGRLEARLESASPAGAEDAPVNHVSKAPAPPTVLGSRPAVAGDEVEAAVQARDAGRYIRAANARELAGR